MFDGFKALVGWLRDKIELPLTDPFRANTVAGEGTITSPWPSTQEPPRGTKSGAVKQLSLYDDRKDFKDPSKGANMTDPVDTPTHHEVPVGLAAPIIPLAQTVDVYAIMRAFRITPDKMQEMRIQHLQDLDIYTKKVVEAKAVVSTIEDAIKTIDVVLATVNKTRGVSMP